MVLLTVNDGQADSEAGPSEANYSPADCRCGYCCL